LGSSQVGLVHIIDTAIEGKDVVDHVGQPVLSRNREEAVTVLVLPPNAGLDNICEQASWP